MERVRFMILIFGPVLLGSEIVASFKVTTTPEPSCQEEVFVGEDYCFALGTEPMTFQDARLYCVENFMGGELASLSREGDKERVIRYFLYHFSSMGDTAAAIDDLMRQFPTTKSDVVQANAFVKNADETESTTILEQKLDMTSGYDLPESSTLEAQSAPEKPGTHLAPEPEKPGTHLAPEPEKPGTHSAPEKSGTPMAPEPEKPGTHLAPENPGTHLAPEKPGTPMEPEPEKPGTHLAPEKPGTHLAPEKLGTHLEPEKPGTRLAPEKRATHLAPEPEKPGTRLAPEKRATHLAPEPEKPGTHLAPEPEKPGTHLAPEKRATHSALGKPDTQETMNPLLKDRLLQAKTEWEHVRKVLVKGMWLGAHRSEDSLMFPWFRLGGYLLLNAETGANCVAMDGTDDYLMKAVNCSEMRLPLCQLLSCPRRHCLNGGRCRRGICTCPESVKGDLCEILPNEDARPQMIPVGARSVPGIDEGHRNLFIALLVAVGIASLFIVLVLSKDRISEFLTRQRRPNHETEDDATAEVIALGTVTLNEAAVEIEEVDVSAGLAAASTGSTQPPTHKTSTSADHRAHSTYVNEAFPLTFSTKGKEDN